MFKHSPGPWHKAEAAASIPIKAANGKTVARVNWGENDDTNANLIIASPDLLNALIATANALEWHEDRMPRGQESGALDLARAAIAKAEGRP